MKLKIIPLVAVLFVIVSCVSTGKYTGSEYYYTVDGVNWSCREPKPYKGGNCKPFNDWKN